jgi:hypothetical protein
MLVFHYFLGWNEVTRRTFFRIMAVILSVIFIMPELSWAFDWRNLKRENKEQPPGIIHVEDLHSNSEAQEKIQQLITQFIQQNKIRLVAVEGSVGFLDIDRLRQLPYPDIKKRLFSYFRQSGQLSGTEAAAISSQESVVLYGVEDAEIYERSLGMVRGFLWQKVQNQFQNVRYLLEELLGAVNTEELAELDEKLEAFQEQKISLPVYLRFLKARAQAVRVNVSEYPEAAELDAKSDWEAHEVEVKTQRLRQAIRTKLYSHPAQQAALDRWREDLDRMERLLNIAAFQDDLAYARGQGLRFSIKAFLDFYQDQASVLGVTAEVEPKLYDLDMRLQEALEFYTLAEKRNRILVENTLRAMKVYKTDRAVLVAGGFHTSGIDAELKARGISRLTVRPNIRSCQDSGHYFRQLSGEFGPFRSLFAPPEKHLLALSSVLELRPEHQDFWQAFGALYLAQVTPLLAQGRNASGFRSRVEALLQILNQGSPYRIRVDWDAWQKDAAKKAVPLILEAGEKLFRITAVSGAWKNSPTVPFYTYHQDQAELSLYNVTLTPALAAGLRERVRPRWQEIVQTVWAGMQSWALGTGLVRRWRENRNALLANAVQDTRPESMLDAYGEDVFFLANEPYVLIRTPQLDPGNAMVHTFYQDAAVVPRVLVNEHTVPGLSRIQKMLEGRLQGIGLLAQCREIYAATNAIFYLQGYGENVCHWASLAAYQALTAQGHRVTLLRHASRGWEVNHFFLKVTDARTGAEWIFDPTANQFAQTGNIFAQDLDRLRLAQGLPLAMAETLDKPEWESRLEQRWQQGILTTADLAQITVQVASAPRAVARWHKWLQRLADPAQAASLPLREFARQLLKQFEAREVASAALTAGVPELHISLGETAQQKAAAILQLYTQAAVVQAQSPWEENENLAGRLAAVQTAMGLVIDTWVREGWWHQSRPEALEALWAVSVQSLDTALRQGMALKRQAGTAESAEGIRFSTLLNIGLFRKGLTGWVQARLQEQTHAGTIDRPQIQMRPALLRLVQWVRENPRMILAGAGVGLVLVYWFLGKKLELSWGFLVAGDMKIVPGPMYGGKSIREEGQPGNPAKIEVELTKHRGENYWREASQNLGTVLRALNVPRDAVVLNVGSGRNPLLAQGYRVLNIDNLMDSDFFAQDGQEVYRADFFNEKFPIQLQDDAKLRAFPSVLVFFNMFRFMGMYGPIQLTNVDERMKYNNLYYLVRAWELLPDGGRIVYMHFMPPEYSNEFAPLDSEQAIKTIREITADNPQFQATLIYHKSREGSSDVVGISLQKNGTPQAVEPVLLQDEKLKTGVLKSADTNDVVAPTPAIPVEQLIDNDWMRVFFRRSDQPGKGELRFSLARWGAVFAAVVGAAGLFSTTLGSTVSLTTLSIAGAVSGLGLALSFMPRLWYVWSVSRPRAPALHPWEIERQLLNVIVDIERQGILPTKYQRPLFRVLPGQSLRSMFGKGILIGRGRLGVVQLHKNFLSLSPAAQRAVLVHEIFEAHTANHALATWQEYRAWVQSALTYLADVFKKNAVAAFWKVLQKVIFLGQYIPVTAFYLAWWLNTTAPAPLRRLAGKPYAPTQDNPEETELTQGGRGEVALIPANHAQTVPVEAITQLLFSRYVSENVRGMVNIELRADEIAPEQLENFARDLMRFNGFGHPRISRTAWQTLNAIQERLSPSLQREVAANLKANRRNGRLVLTTSPQRLKSVYGFMLAHQGIQQLLQRPGGVVINDVGLGGPVPFTTAELTKIVKAINPDNSVVGADILLPAFRTWDFATGVFAYHNAAGEIVGLYHQDGKPLAEAENPAVQARFREQFFNFQNGLAVDQNIEVTPDPIQAYALKNGFTVQTASYGRDIPAGIKLCFNVMYMNPGKETQIINRMGQDLETGGYLLNGFASTQNEVPYARFVLYQKQADGSMRPLGVHFFYEDTHYEFPMKPGMQTIRAAENLAMEDFSIYGGELAYEDEMFGRYGLNRRDLRVTRLLYPALPTPDLVLRERWAFAGNELRVSPLRAVMAAGAALAIGAIVSSLFSPTAVLTTLSVWGAMSGLGLAVIYAPRLYYWLRLRQGRAPKLDSDAAGALLRSVFAEIERVGGLPASYRRPRVEVLPRQNWLSALLRGVLVGQGLKDREGRPLVRLHASFLSLPFGAQVAVLRHEVFEAFGQGHVRATWEEYKSYFQAKSENSSIREPLEVKLNQGRLEFNSTDPEWLRAWERLLATASGMVLQALTQHIQGGGRIRFARASGDLLIQQQGSLWILDPRLLLGQAGYPGAVFLAPAPNAVWELALGQVQVSGPGIGIRAWAFRQVFTGAAARQGMPAMVQAEAWLRQASLRIVGDVWRSRLGFNGIWDILRRQAGSVRSSELAAWLQLNLLRPVLRLDTTKAGELTVPQTVANTLRSQITLHVRAYWIARQAVQIFSQLPQTQRGNLKLYSDDTELLAAINMELSRLNKAGNDQAKQVLQQMQAVPLLGGQVPVAAPAPGLLVLTRQNQLTAPVVLAGWAKLISQGRVYVFGSATTPATAAFAAEKTVDWNAWQNVFAAAGRTVVGQEAEWLQAGLGEKALEEDQLAEEVEERAVNSGVLQQELRVSVLGAQTRSARDAVLRDAAAQIFDELAYGPEHQVLSSGIQMPLPIARIQSTETTPWEYAARANAAKELPAGKKSGARLRLEVKGSSAMRAPLGLRNRLYLALAASIFMTRKVSLLQKVFGRAPEVHGLKLWAIVRHSQFWTVSQTLWAVTNGTLMVQGEVDPVTAAEVKAALNRNPVFKAWFGKSAWVDALQRETAALRRETERLGDIGLELAPAAYLKYQLEQQLTEAQVAPRERGLLLRNLWENASWTNNLARLQALSRSAEQGADAARQQLRLQRLERRLLTALLAEMQQPGADAAYQLAVVKAMSVFTPERQVRIRLAVSAGNTVTYPAYWVPELVLHHPHLRNQLVNHFPVYDDSGQELKPADPSVIRTLAGSA